MEKYKKQFVCKKLLIKAFNSFLCSSKNVSWHSSPLLGYPFPTENRNIRSVHLPKTNIYSNNPADPQHASVKPRGVFREAQFPKPP